MAVATYRLPDVHAALATLPPWEATSRDALSLAGRAHHEAAAYAPAAAAYAAALAAAPARLEGVVDYYSTALWQLRAAAPAVALASAAVAVDRGCPAAWVAAGNAFSLAGDADTALRFFRRAVQLDPGGAAYAYTLAGHELRGKAAAGPAAAAYRRALVVDGRAVGALYGLAALAEARDAWAEARGYYAAALAVAPRNGKLRYHLGVTLARGGGGGGGLPAALRELRLAVRYDAAAAAATVVASAAAAAPGAGGGSRPTSAADGGLVADAGLLPRGGGGGGGGGGGAAAAAAAAASAGGGLMAAFEAARVLAALGRLGDARAELRALLAVAPSEAALWYELGRVEKAAGGGAAALRAFSTALGLAPRERRYKRALDTVYAVDEDDL